jgi:mitochondrial fission protein ELM1
MSDTAAVAALTCWVVSDGNIGMETQCLGLAEAIGVRPEIKRLSIRWPWRWLIPQLWPAPLMAPGPAGDLLTPPWPDLLIATGRMSAAPAMAIRRASGGLCFTVQIQDPRCDPRAFDLLVVPDHDRVRGENVMVTFGSLNRVTPERLAVEGRAIAADVAALAQPRVAVLIGGSNGHYQLTPEVMTTLGRQLADLARAAGAGLMVTPSRRTGEENVRALRSALGDLPADRLLFWDGRTPNPYFGYLAHADAIVVTPDSVNMVCESLSTGKPVHVVDLPVRRGKFASFHERLRAEGYTRRFEGRIERWSYAALDETRRVAAEVRRRLAAKRERTLAPG